MKTDPPKNEQSSSGIVVRDSNPDTPDVRTYHCPWVLISTREEMAYRNTPTPENKIIASLLQIPGVACVYALPYSAAVQKGAAFSWEEIDLQVRKVLESAKVEHNDPLIVLACPTLSQRSGD